MNFPITFTLNYFHDRYACTFLIGFYSGFVFLKGNFGVLFPVVFLQNI